MEGLQSFTQELLDEGPKTQKIYGDRAFSICGPKPLEQATPRTKIHQRG